MRIFSATLALTFFTMGCASTPLSVPRPDPKRALVYDVQGVEVVTLKTRPSKTVVEARGQTLTGGWTHAQLVPHGEPRSGELQLDFVARPPHGVATAAITPITAAYIVPPDQGKAFRSVRVNARTNSKTAGR